MLVTFIGHTRSHLERDSESLIDNFKAFAGANGGICYMKDKYFDTYVTDWAKAKKRFDTIVPTGHHSVAEHVQVTALLEDIPKIVAMYLNNLNNYATSEKSGRYTEMTGNTDLEVELYNKWLDIYTSRIIDTYGSRIDSRTVDKLAKENARYLLSIFTPTTMSYTTSIRQWNYIMDWLEGYDFSCFKDGYFKENLEVSFKELRGHLEPLRIDELRDTKARSLNLVNNERVAYAREQYGENYAILYDVTFVELAQAHRHRTLNHSIYFDGECKGFFVPPIIEGTSFESEWLEDLAKVAHLIPQGTEVRVLERGDTEEFFLKVKERICGRAQIEIAVQTAATVKKFVEHKSEMSNYLQNILESYIREDGSPKSKCELLKCKEVCVWGAKGAITRKI